MFSRTVGDAFDETMDPYCFSDRHLIDDIRQWLAVDFPAIYTHLIDTPGGYTREKLKAFKSLEAHKYFTRYPYKLRHTYTSGSKYSVFFSVPWPSAGSSFALICIFLSMLWLVRNLGCKPTGQQ